MNASYSASGLPFKVVTQTVLIREYLVFTN